MKIEKNQEKIKTKINEKLLQKACVFLAIYGAALVNWYIFLFSKLR